MVWPRLATRTALVGAAIIIGIGPVAARAAATAPPDGSYAFAVSRGGVKVGTAAVTVRRAAPSVTVHEVETFTGVTETADESLDMDALSPTSYVSSFPVTSDIGVTARISFDSLGARETVDGVTGSTDFRLESGTSRLVVVDGAMATGFLFLPAQVKAQQLTAFTLLSPSLADTYYCTVNASATPPRPPGLPGGDVSLTIDGSAPSSTTEFDIWYDPQTLNVDEIDVPSQETTIARVRTP